MKTIFISIDQEKTGKRICELMDKKNLKVTDVAEACGYISLQSVYKWRKGESVPGIDNLVVLSELFHESMDSIIVRKSA